MLIQAKTMRGGIEGNDGELQSVCKIRTVKVGAEVGRLRGEGIREVGRKHTKHLCHVLGRIKTLKMPSPKGRGRTEK